MIRFRDLEGDNVSLEKSLNVTDRCLDLSKEETSSDLTQNPLLLLWGLVLSVPDHVLNSARNDHSLPVLEQFQGLLMLIAVLFELRKTLKVGVPNLNVLAIVDYVH